MIDKKIITLFILLFILNISSHTEDNTSPKVHELIGIISKCRNINSIYCAFTQTAVGNERMDICTGELAYFNGNIYYSITYQSPEVDNSNKKKLSQSDTPQNLFEIFVKKRNEKLIDIDEKPQQKETLKASFSQKEGRYIYCLYNYHGKKEESTLCSEFYTYKEQGNRCPYLWITRYNLLHTLGISFLPIGGVYQEQGVEQYYVGEDWIPLPKKPFYNSLVKTLQEDLKKNYPPDFFKTYTKGEYTILLYNYSTSFWFDKNNNITKITQDNFFANALRYEEELKRRYNGDITDFLENARFTYIYSDFKDFPEGVRIPLKVELIRLSGIPDAEFNGLVNNFIEARNNFKPDSKEFESIEKEFILNRAILGVKKHKYKTLSHITTIIYPDSLVINKEIPEEVFTLKIDEGTPIYKGDNFQQEPTYIDPKNQKDIYSKYFKINSSLLIFIIISIGFTIILIFITKKFLGWGM
ncbi:MAG: hypothetical protein N2169_07715 [bacterium]|nr:hypothetical protein [bacterium]